jgi:hypothetical protein
VAIGLMIAFGVIDAPSIRAQSCRLGRPVLDMTKLNGTYDFSLRLDILEGMTNGDSDPKPKAANWSTSSIFTDIEKQLGLKLEADRAPVDTLVIDHAENPLKTSGAAMAAEAHRPGLPSSPLTQSGSAGA